jgi:hypothetical protein
MDNGAPATLLAQVQVGLQQFSLLCDPTRRSGKARVKTDATVETTLAAPSPSFVHMQERTNAEP